MFAILCSNRYVNAKGFIKSLCEEKYFETHEKALAFADRKIKNNDKNSRVFGYEVEIVECDENKVEISERTLLCKKTSDYSTELYRLNSIREKMGLAPIC